MEQPSKIERVSINQGDAPADTKDIFCVACRSGYILTNKGSEIRIQWYAKPKKKRAIRRYIGRQIRNERRWPEPPDNPYPTDPNYNPFADIMSPEPMIINPAYAN